MIGISAHYTYNIQYIILHRYVHCKFATHHKSHKYGCTVLKPPSFEHCGFISHLTIKFPWGLMSNLYQVQKFAKLKICAFSQKNYLSIVILVFSGFWLHEVVYSGVLRASEIYYSFIVQFFNANTRKLDCTDMLH